MRNWLLLALLFVVAFGAWNLVHLEDATHTPEPVSKQPAAEVEVDPEPEVRGPEALSLEHHPKRVADDADILGHYGPTLTWQTQAWRDDLGIEFHVATLANAAHSIDELAADVFTRRAIGDDAPTGGILLILDPVARRARIEVSYTLEGAFPDALVGRITEDQLVPYVAYSAIGMATMDVLHLLKDVAIQQSLRGNLALEDLYRNGKSYLERARFLSGGAGAQVELPSIEDLASRDFKAAVPDARRARYAPSSDPVESVAALLRTQRELVGDPDLELFTPGSRCMKDHYPFAAYEVAERAQSLEAARPWRIATRGDRAVVTAGTKVHGFVPVLLHRIEGTWRVDTVETWKNLFFDQNGDYRLRNTNNPYTFGLGAHGGGTRHEDIEAWNLGGAALGDVIQKLEATKGRLYDYLLGELLFRNCFLPDKAFLHYEAASEGASSPLFAETLGDRASYVGFHDLAIEAYGRMKTWGHTKLAAAHAAKGDLDRAIEVARQVVDRNPYDVSSLRALHGYLVSAERREQAATAMRRIKSLQNDPVGRQRPIAVAFDPIDPTYDITQPTLVGNTKIFDHAYFTLSLTNPSQRPVEIQKINLRTVGKGMSGLGDIRRFFRWPTKHRLEPGQSVQVARTWGFTIDTPDDQLSYVVDVCWSGEGDDGQCGTHRLDLMPR